MRHRLQEKDGVAANSLPCSSNQSWDVASKDIWQPNVAFLSSNNELSHFITWLLGTKLPSKDIGIRYPNAFAVVVFTMVVKHVT
ncbi:hypothetical protein CEXT_771061 [Caerostris extrusa]|uniref:Uncharacterized protein n=1 Tax=Caerostris extrusa TaxID=172846 RepID=A0AAV4PQ42_CAEEX|nr:hypothetical protein CEXT_771061 [Caerostris extrusa]